MLRILPDILKEEEGLGAHSSVLVLSHRFAVEYFWVHKDLRPFGDTLTLQCPKCFAIRTLTFKLLDNKSGEFQASCHCGWTDQKLSGKGNALMLKGSQGSCQGPIQKVSAQRGSKNGLGVRVQSKTGGENKRRS